MGFHSFVYTYTSKQNLYTTIHSSIMHNSKKNGNNSNVYHLLDNKMWCYQHNGILFNHKKKRSTDTWYTSNKIGNQKESILYKAWREKKGNKDEDFPHSQTGF